MGKAVVSETAAQPALLSHWVMGQPALCASAESFGFCISVHPFPIASWTLVPGAAQGICTLTGQLWLAHSSWLMGVRTYSGACS